MSTRRVHRSIGSPWHRSLLFACVLAVGTASAQTALQGAAAPRPAPVKPSAASGQAEGPAWADLSPGQREQLAPLERDWAGIEGSRKSKWLEVAARLPSMPVDERDRIRQRMVEWARMTPAERGRARMAFLDTKQLSREEKQARWEAYRSLPESERNALAARGRHQAVERPAAASAPASPRPALPPIQPLAGLQGSAAASAPAASGDPRPMIAKAKPAATAASAPPPKQVGPTIVQGKPGATTTLMTRAPKPPAHQQPGQPKIAANAVDVDPATLLPRNGPQAAPVHSLRP